MNPGDIIFFSARTVRQKANILGQWKLTGQWDEWSHVAVSIYGPLIIHAMPEGGAHLTVLDKELIDDERYIVARPLAALDPMFEEKLADACIYWLGQEYTPILNIYRSRRHSSPIEANQTFCSYVVQHIYNHLSVEPFLSIDQPLLPVELYNLLSSNKSWSVMTNQSLLPGQEKNEQTESARLKPEQYASTLMLAYMKLKLLVLRTEVNIAAGQMSVGTQALEVVTSLIALQPDLSATEKMKKIKEILAQLKDSGYEGNTFLYYRNFMPIFLSHANLIQVGHLTIAFGCFTSSVKGIILTPIKWPQTLSNLRLGWLRFLARLG
jgi:hypothetical protein